MLTSRVPASTCLKTLLAGTNIFRLNCSHRRGGDFERVYPLIRKYAKDPTGPWDPGTLGPDHVT